MVGVTQEEDITKPDSRDMVLLVLYLYQTLPHLIPKTTLDFAGKLGGKQVGSVRLPLSLAALCLSCACHLVQVRTPIACKLLK